jgi:hypothetical protein
VGTVHVFVQFIECPNERHTQLPHSAVSVQTPRKSTVAVSPHTLPAESSGGVASGVALSSLHENATAAMKTRPMTVRTAR